MKKPPVRGENEKDMTLAATYSSNGLPREYHRRVGLNFRVRDGNGCFPDAMTTRVMSSIENEKGLQVACTLKTVRANDVPDLLVLVSSTHCCAYTSSLSTW
jgi:hypothetical protein